MNLVTGKESVVNVLNIIGAWENFRGACFLLK